MPTWLDDIQTSLHNLGGAARLTDIYAEVKRVRPGPHPKSIDATIRGTIERHSSDSLAHTGANDVFFSVKGLGSGIWGLRSQIAKTPIANDFAELPEGTATPARYQQSTYRVLRETELARKLKLLHGNSCQICSTVITIGSKLYSEAHHLIPLGTPHNGPDIPSNIVVVCPNCHVKLDYFSVTLSVEEIRATKGHRISEESINYHNQKVENFSRQ